MQSRFGSTPRRAVPGGRPHQFQSSVRIGHSHPLKIIRVVFFVKRPADLPRVKQFAHGHGLRIVTTRPFQRMIVLSGSIRQFSTAFRVQFFRIKVNGVFCRDVSRAATLPAGLAGRVVYVGNLKTFPPRRRTPMMARTSTPVRAVVPGGKPNVNSNTVRVGP
ncbi:MAG TPA: protease pro-enzyme activation domain-containing protein, partial [Candidatus Acidoferrum sp.]|nr:protease pro-enzyme activation domain-containing protein [Candidatus Acidoferrum sp.]